MLPQVLHLDGGRLRVARCSFSKPKASSTSARRTQP